MGMKRKIKSISGGGKVYIMEAFDEFIQFKEARNLAPKTIKNYEQSFEYFCNYHEITQETTMEEIKEGLFFKWMNSMKLDGVRHTSINHYLRDTRAFFYWCMEKDYLDSFKIPLVEGQEETPKMFSDEELEVLLERPKDKDNFPTWRTWAVVNWVLATGCRASTICEVRIEDIDFTRSEIILAHTKNKKAQIIPLSPSLTTILKEYTRRFEIEEWLFPNIGAEKLTTNALAHSFSHYCKSRGVSRTNIHGLRHNFAKIYIKNGGSHLKLQKLLGHQNGEMTRHYVKLFTEDLKDDFETYSPLDTIKKGYKRTNRIKRL